MKSRIICLISTLFLSLALLGQPKVVTVHPFECKVYVFTDSCEYKTLTGFDVMDEAVCQTSISDSGIAIFLQDKNCLDHELIHVTWFILDHYGVTIDADNHEIQAYLFEYLKMEIEN